MRHKYRLKDKSEAFQVVDGKFAGRSFKHGEVYDEIPPEEKSKFVRVKPKGAKKS